MTELLVRVVSKSGADRYLDAQLTKRGDVIVMVEDGHVWSAAELHSPEYVVIRVVDAPMESLSWCVVPESNKSTPSRLRQRRKFFIDIDALEAQLDRRLSIEKTAPVTLNCVQLNLLRLERLPLVDPDVFGSDDVEL